MTSKMTDRFYATTALGILDTALLEIDLALTKEHIEDAAIERENAARACRMLRSACPIVPGVLPVKMSAGSTFVSHIQNYADELAESAARGEPVNVYLDLIEKHLEQLF